MTFADISQNIINIISKLQVQELISLFGVVFVIIKAISLWLDRRKNNANFERDFFTKTLNGLSSDSHSERITSAILLRRFLTHNSKFHIGGIPRFKKDALNVISSLLRIEKYSEFQKTLADSLSYVNDLPNEQDFQFTNLQNAFIQHKPNKKIRMKKADFFMADLSYASFNNLNLSKAVFCQANLFQTRFKDCDFTGANFCGADMKETIFKDYEEKNNAYDNTDGRCKNITSKIIGIWKNKILKEEKNTQKKKRCTCTFTGANFNGATNIPDKILSHLNEKGIWEEMPKTKYKPKPQSRKVFISCLGNLTLEQSRFVDALELSLFQHEISYTRYTRERYRHSGQLRNVVKEMTGCDSVIVLGFKSIKVETGIYRPDTTDEQVLKDKNISTPWSGIEAGMACALGKPVLLLCENKMIDGIFDPKINDMKIHRIEMNDANISSIVNWVNTIQ